MKKIRIQFLILTVAFSLVPLFANATDPNNVPGYDSGSGGVPISTASTCSLSSYSDIVTCAIYILNTLIPIIIALIIVWIIWSAFQFARLEGEDRNKHRDSMVWGIVAIFVAVSIYGLVAILTGTFGTNSTQQIKAPNVTLGSGIQQN